MVTLAGQSIAGVDVSGSSDVISQEHLSGYQARDYEVVDYQMTQESRTGLYFRGPAAEMKPGDYVTCLGAAQTFGCFCNEPFPRILERELGASFVNFGYGGAGPAFFLKYPALIDIANAGKFVILQVMSGRSESNTVYDAGGLEYVTRRRDGKKLSAQQAYQDLIDAAGPADWPAPARKAYRMFSGGEELKSVLKETRANWVANNKELIEQIKVPIVLLWFSRRSPNLNRTRRFAWWWQRYDNANSMFGDYPQLVNASMVNSIVADVHTYVDCTTRRGSPQPLYSRFTGEPVTVDAVNDRADFGSNPVPVNDYYPSPEMHVDAAQSLAPICRKLLSIGS